MLLPMNPTPPLAALALLMVGLVTMNLPVTATLLSLGAVAAGGARLFDPMA